MFEKYDSPIRQRKGMVAPLSKFYGECWFGFCLNTRKRVFLEISFYFKANKKSISSSRKRY